MKRELAIRGGHIKKKWKVQSVKKKKREKKTKQEEYKKKERKEYHYWDLL